MPANKIPAPERTRLAWPDCLRCAAIFQIVTWHAEMQFGSALSGMYGISGPLFESGTMEFVLLAGFFAGPSSGKSTWGKYFGKRLYDIFLPYAAASFLILLLLRMSRSGVFSPLELLRDFLFSLPYGTASIPLWFVPMILLFFAAAPILAGLLKKDRFGLSSLLLISLLFIGRGKHTEFWRNTAYFFPVFLSGLWLGLNGKAFLEKIQRRAVLIPLLIVTCTLLAVTIFYSENMPIQTVARMAFAAMLLSIFLKFSGILSGMPLQLVHQAAGCAMSVYLYHNSIIGPACKLFSRAAAGTGTAGNLAALLAAGLACTAALILFFLGLKFLLKKAGMNNSRPLLGC